MPAQEVRVMLGRTNNVHPPSRHRLVDAMNAVDTTPAHSPGVKHDMEDAVQGLKDAPTSPVTGTHLSFVQNPPPALPSPPPPAPPLNVVCVPTVMDMTSGCRIRVIYAEPGSTLLIRIRANSGGEMNLTLPMPAGQNTTHAEVVTGSGTDGLPEIEGTVEYADSPSSLVAIGIADPDLTITEAACRCGRFIFFWDRCLLYSNYSSRLPGRHQVRLVAHSSREHGQDEGHYTFWLPQKTPYIPRLSMPFKRPDIGHITLNLFVPELGVYASRPCID